MRGRRPLGQGTGSDTTWGQETTQGPGRGRNRDQGAEKEDTTADTRTQLQEGHTTTEEPAPPHPKRTPHKPRGRTPPTYAAGARIGRRTDHSGTRPPATGSHGGDGGHTYTGRTGYTHRGSRWEHRRAAHHHILTARRRPRPPQGPPHRHRKRTKAGPHHPGLGAGTPRGHRTKAQAPQRGQPHGHLPNPPARAARPGPHSTDPASHPHLTAPPSHQPATLRPALRTTTQARLGSTDPPRYNTRQHGTPHRSAPQCNAPQQGTPKHNRPQQDNATRHRAAHHGTARRNTAHHRTPQRQSKGR